MPRDLPRDYAARIRQLRARIGLTEARLAELLGVSFTTVSRWETGRSRPSPLAWQQIARLEADGASDVGGDQIGTPMPATTDPAPGPSSPPIPSNLPIPMTSFIGRERELDQLAALLSATRLLTLTGPGGCGKTRLALEVAREATRERQQGQERASTAPPSPQSSFPSARYPDGIWLVSLGPLGETSVVAEAVAATWGLREQSGRSRSETLRDFLGPKQLLLVLDNCEHLVTACAELAGELLGVCPGLQILATSREMLNIAGELIWRVPSLSLPATENSPSILDSEAVRLFVERACCQDPEFAVTSENVPALHQICRRLDGIPLALELAAARVKVLSVEQIAARLDDRFQLLVGRSRGAPQRQQTLRAAVDWSYDLVTEAEQRLFTRLSVFAGSFGLDAAEAVCGSPPGALSIPDKEGVKNGADLERPSPHRFGAGIGEASSVLELLYGLGSLAMMRDERAAARAAFDESRALALELGDGALLAEVIQGLHVLAWREGDKARALHLFEEGLTTAREVGDTWVIASLLRNAGYRIGLDGDYPTAREMLGEGLRLHREIGYKYTARREPDNPARRARSGDRGALFGPTGGGRGGTGPDGAGGADVRGDRGGVASARRPGPPGLPPRV